MQDTLETKKKTQTARNQIIFGLGVLSAVVGFFGILSNAFSSSDAINIFRIFILPIVGILTVYLSTKHFFFRLLGKKLEKHITLIFVLSFVFYVFVMISLKLAKLYWHHYDFFDAGLYFHKIWKISVFTLNDAARIALLEGHFQPILLIFNLFTFGGYAPEAAFFLETLSLASCAIAIFKLAELHFKQPLIKLFISLSFLLNPLLHFNDILGFHPDHLILPSLLWGLYFWETARIRVALIFFFLGLLSSEPFFPSLAFLGLALFLSTKQRVASFFLAIVASVLFLVVIFLLTNETAPNLATSLLDERNVFSFISSPSVEKFTELLDLRKGFFIYFVFIPVLFSPLLYWPAVIVLIPEFMKVFLSTEPLHFAIEGHYTLVFLAMGYWALIRVLSGNFYYLKVNALKLSLASLVLSMCLSIGHGVLPFSLNFWLNLSAKNYHYSNYFESERAMDVQKIIAAGYLHDDDRLVVTNDAFIRDFARRKDFKFFEAKTISSANLVIIGDSKIQTSGAETKDEQYRNVFDKLIWQVSKCSNLSHLTTITIMRFNSECLEGF
jgi:uncharacterized membrane protein